MRNNGRVSQASRPSSRLKTLSFDWKRMKDRNGPGLVGARACPKADRNDDFDELRMNLSVPKANIVRAEGYGTKIKDRCQTLRTKSW